MKILALDLATRTGWATWDGGRINSGSCSFKPKRGESHGMIMLRFGAWLEDVLQKFQPRLVAYEQPHHRGGAATAILNKLVGKTEETVEVQRRRGRQIELAVYHSMTIKKGVMGDDLKKGTKKADVMKRVREMFPRQDIENDDQADALALLITTIKDLAI